MYLNGRMMHCIPIEILNYESNIFRENKKFVYTTHSIYKRKVEITKTVTHTNN